jgi:hypothetical protein
VHQQRPAKFEGSKRLQRIRVLDLFLSRQLLPRAIILFKRKRSFEIKVNVALVGMINTIKIKKIKAKK